MDQYIKLCQQQIQKLTIENAQLRHDKLVFKNMNQNLLELGGGKGSDRVKAGSLGLSNEGKYSVRFVTILKENIKVGNVYWLMMSNLINIIRLKFNISLLSTMG